MGASVITPFTRLIGVEDAEGSLICMKCAKKLPDGSVLTPILPDAYPDGFTCDECWNSTT
jgi:hypothetical protein